MKEDQLSGDRRRIDRRTRHVRLADYTIPEVRKALITTSLLVTILALFVYMVHDVFVAVVVGVVLAIYILPFQDWLGRRITDKRALAIVTITCVTVPLLALIVYSWVEISNAAEYLQAHHEAIAHRLTLSARKLPFAERVDFEDTLSRTVAGAARRTTRFVEALQDALDILVISIAVFLFTTFYVLTDHQRIGRYLRGKIPGRYRNLAGRVGDNMRLVIYGALYATFLTQLVKSAIVLLMNVLWDVPLAFVLAIVSFFVGFFPIVGSWSVYTPVAVYIAVWRGDLVGGILMFAIGFFGNTLFISMYLRPKIAAERSQVLNFYWMFIALVTGVYTFGLVGIIIGPVLIGVLKAIFDTITGEARRVSIEAAEPEVSPPPALGHG